MFSVAGRGGFQLEVEAFGSIRASSVTYLLRLANFFAALVYVLRPTQWRVGCESLYSCDGAGTNVAPTFGS